MSKRKASPHIINLPRRHNNNDESSDSDVECDIRVSRHQPIANGMENLFISNKCPLDIEIEDQVQISNVHIRVQQRRANSYITTLQGLSAKLDIKVILKALKHTLHCNGSITKDPEHGPVIQLSGDQREHIKTFLIDEGICEKNQIIMHGF
ncbi:putative protein translation factor SUI1 [Faustovirus]|nr:putative translation factor SUI1 [Faustovirus]QJX72750.1 putative protein translation factor SUI1 [Faustovirus]